MDVHPFGDRAVLVALGAEISPHTLARVLAVDRALAALPAVTETVPAYASVLAVLDPRRGAPGDIAAALRDSGEPASADPPGRAIEVPVAYGSALGPDLDAVAALSGLPPERVIERHAAVEYLVYMLGFAPGFPYMGILPPEVVAPRLDSPRTRVPAGSVAVAGRQTGIYPFETPGGWRLIGRTPLAVFDPSRPRPAALAAGDRVRFVPVAPGAFERTDPPRPSPPRAARPALLVRSGGLLTTVQDLGRPGHRRIGVPPSGAMDPDALIRANRLVGNADGAAALECAPPGPALEALADVEIALSGADLSPAVDGRAVALDAPLRLGRGGVLTFGAGRRGLWAYVAVGGGIDVPAVLGSRSTYARAALGGYAGRRLGPGDVLGRGESRAGGPAAPAGDAGGGPIRLIPGPHAGAFPDGALETLLRGAYAVSLQSDRAGYRLQGPPVPVRPEDRVSQAVVPGAIQVPPGGAPIVVMPDGPTVGGYPVLAVVRAGDLPRLAQTPPRAPVRFAL